MDNFDHWAQPYYVQAAFGLTSCYLLNVYFLFLSIYFITKHFCEKIKLRCRNYDYGKRYIDKHISCIYVANKKTKLRRFITNESLLNGTVRYLRNDELPSSGSSCADTFQITTSRDSTCRSRTTSHSKRPHVRVTLFILVW